MVVTENRHLSPTHCARRICLHRVHACRTMTNCIDIIPEKKTRKVKIEYVWNVIKALSILKLKVLGITGE